MNFLAHAWLAAQAAESEAAAADLVVGGMIGDSVKGRLPAGLTEGLAAGVHLHRAIDVFAESDEAFRRSRARLSPERRRVAGVIVDMVYDHFLARHWSHFAAEPLTGFTARTYALLRARAEELPPAFQHMLPRMQTHDWLASYADFSVLERALERMAERLSRPALLRGSGAEAALSYAGLEADFLAFLPRARAAARAVRAQYITALSDAACNGVGRGE